MKRSGGLTITPNDGSCRKTSRSSSPSRPKPATSEGKFGDAVKNGDREQFRKAKLLSVPIFRPHFSPRPRISVCSLVATAGTDLMEFDDIAERIFHKDLIGVLTDKTLNLPEPDPE